MIKNSKVDINLLEDLQEELAPRVIGNCGHTPQLTKESLASLYHVISDYLVRNSESNLPNSVMKSLREVP